MLQTNKIKIRDLKELQADEVLLNKNVLSPLRKRKNPKSADKRKKVNVLEQDNKNIVENSANTNTLTKIATKTLLKCSIKETPTNQKRIDSYFTSCPKTYEIKIAKEEPATQCVKTKFKTTAKKTKSANKNKKSPRRTKLKRKRLFSDTTDATAEDMSVVSSIMEMKVEPVCITIDSDSEDEPAIKNEVQSPAETPQTKTNTPPATVINVVDNQASFSRGETSIADKSQTFSSSTSASSLSFGLRMSKTSCGQTNTTSKSSTGRTSVNRRKTKPCPPYKIIENTTFAVDAFQFGYIDNVTHYFLTHFHADHYIGLTKSFAMPLYMSTITARLLRTFIPVQEQYIHELELNETCIINGIEVTALDANHCPGSILLVFKIPDTNKYILHTGDFRAWHGMESEPIFWNNPIHTIYLDTTYISDKYSFCTQDESITKAKVLIDKFIEKHPGKRILYICGSYIIGKEKFWSKLAEDYNLKVWAEGNRYKALKAMNEEQFNKLLVEEPNEANMHVLAMAKVTYLELVEYFKSYQHLYDIVFAIRPSGWEKNSKPRYGGKINIIGIEYSEHSSYTEMQRFVKYLKPEQVLSTVPTGKDLMKTAKIPINWYKYNTLKPSSNYQPSIDSCMARTPQINSSLRSLSTRRGSLEHFVSPLKSITPNNHGEINNNNLDTETAISMVSSKPTNTEEIDTNIKTEINSTQTLNQENSYNFVVNTPHLTKTTTSKCSTNSSEYFERTDLVISSKKIERIKKEVNNKKEINSKAKTKTKKSEKTLAYTTRKLQQKNTNIKERNNSNNSEDSADLFQHEMNTSCAKLQTNLDKSKENPIFKSTTTSIYSLSDDEVPTTSYKKSLKTNTLASSEKSSKEKYGLINHESNVFNQHYLPDIKEESEEINPDTKENFENETEFYNYKMSNGHKQNSTKQFNISEGILPDPPTTSNKTYTEHDANLTITLSQKRITRSKSASSKATTSSYTSQNNNEQEFENKLQKITNQYGKMNNNKFQKNSKRILDKTKENPIYKSTTTTISIDSRSEEELSSRNFLPQQFITNTLTGSDRSSEERECKRNTKNSKSGMKRANTNHNSTPFKKKSTTLSLDTTAILNTILEHNEDIDRFNCSQLAGLVVEKLHKHNPDNSKDHIPSDLLSDADDDWI